MERWLRRQLLLFVDSPKLLQGAQSTTWIVIVVGGGRVHNGVMAWQEWCDGLASTIDNMSAQNGY